MTIQEQHLLLDQQLKGEALLWLKDLIAIPSFSREEQHTADYIEQLILSKGLKPERLMNNVWVRNSGFDASKPTVLLNSHHDTVKPNAGYSLNPFDPIIKGGKLFGLGSNDAGGALVTLLAVFFWLNKQEHLNYNFIFLASAEEEMSGQNGVELVLPQLGKINFGIVGEPTQMHLAVAEKGLMVVDCVAQGKSGHAAREEGENAIYKALTDIEWCRQYTFEKTSASLGKVKMSVTIINAGVQHNVVPDICRFTIDVRTTDCYSNEEVLEIMKANLQSEVKARSTRLNSSSIPINHPLIQAGIECGRTTYGSPTTSDQALMNFPTLKMGPGDSARSHTADEFIYVQEIKDGIEMYIKILNKII